MLEGEKNNLQAHTRKKNFIVNQGVEKKISRPDQITHPPPPPLRSLMVGPLHVHEFVKKNNNNNNSFNKKQRLQIMLPKEPNNVIKHTASIFLYFVSNNNVIVSILSCLNAMKCFFFIRGICRRPCRVVLH